ncbi:class I SAM-dependent DNA methyltransferase [Muribaculaceae bacterium Isolate-036 (Harlan)]|nr:class I SAM-dependent DNA methyltransferase [Muribaculaceae bacterium Isolate-036 (Harlan)]
MAKKTKSYSQVQATDALEHLGQHGTSASEFIYDLLRIFAGYGDGQIRRTKDGPGNLAKDGETVLIKNLVAYREAVVNTLDGDCSKMYDVINAMRDDAKIAKHSPRLYITSNGVFVVAYDPKENDWYENRIDLLWKDFEFFTPLAGIEKIQFTAEAEVDVKSAELMAKLFDDIRRYNDIRDPQTVHALNVFMSRLLFCFFAEDTGLFPEDNLFTNTLRTHTKEDGSDLAEFIDRVFMAMATAPSGDGRDLSRPYSAFPYVNGGLFRDRYPIPVLSRRARTLIINCGEYNWREINPDIFGSMIQAVVTPEHRASLGMHYTSVPNIEKVIRPLFLDALEEEFEAACTEAREKMAKKANHNRASQRLRNLLNRLSNIKFFDPACGSGNFLIITYKRLRELEIRIWKAMREITGMALLPFPNITLTQFYGIELDEYAAETATLSMWLAEHQMNVKFQEELFVLPETLPLKPSGHIVCGNACRLDWNTICPHTPEDEVYIMGNPPYLGSKLQDESQKEDMKFAMQGTDAAKTVDYIAAWFWKGAKYIRGTKAKYAFVTTNSISQGEQVAMLWKPIFDLGLEVSFARTSFKWSNNAKHNAAVIVVIIGVQNKESSEKRLFIESSKTEKKVKSINPYLSDGDSNIVFKTNNVPYGLPDVLFGSMPRDGGHLNFERDTADLIRQQYPEAAKFVKRYVGSQELLQDIERYCLWIEDTAENIQLANSIPEIRERLLAVSGERAASNAASTQAYANRPHMFVQRAYKPTKAVIIPSVSSERREYIPIGFVDKDTVISNLAFAIYDAEKWLFALLTSKMHNLWVRTVGGRLKSDIRYSQSLCYNTFPFPKLTADQKEELEELAKNILNIRDENFDMTLGEMYNPESMPDELREAHHQLDFAVERIYRPEPFTSDEERLEHLFKLYAKMTKNE